MDKAFGFPPYFGENWDALWDCMRDMYWINDSEIILELRNSNALIGKLKSEIISFFEDLKTHLEKSNKNLEQKVHFDFKLLN
jgi:RNAse (barnase) inhibitor barstar